MIKDILIQDILRKAADNVCTWLNNTSEQEAGQTNSGQQVWDRVATLHKEICDVVAVLDHPGINALSGTTILSLPRKPESKVPIPEPGVLTKGLRPSDTVYLSSPKKEE